jgi:2-C-methyl-D-erythritol 2,4-cyclodiphosphate synthase
LVWDKGYKVVNVDIVIMAEEPKLAGYRSKMMDHIAQVLNISRSQVGIKATTCEGLGSIGRAEGIYSQAIALIQKKGSHEYESKS